MPKVRKNPNPTTSTGSLPAVTPIEIDRVRRSVLDVVRRNIPEVRDVLQGKKTWNTAQVNLFKSMLNKVMPDLHHSFAEHHHEHRKVEELSREELIEIAQRGDPEEKRSVGRPRNPENEELAVMTLDCEVKTIQ